MLPSLKVKIGADTGDLNKKLDSARQRIARFAKVAAAAMAAAGVATGALVARSMAAVDAQAKLAQSLGTSTSSVQTLARAGELAGVSMSGIEQATKDLTRRLSQAAAGTGPAADALAQLGLSAEQLMEMPLDQRVALINAAIRKFVPAAQRAAVAGQLFGEEGSIAISRLEPEVIAQAADEVNRLGVALTDVQADRIEAANDAMSKLGLAFTGVGNQIAAKVAPALEQLALKLVDLIAQLQPAAVLVGTALAGAFDLLGRMIDFASNNIEAITVAAGLFVAGGLASFLSRVAVNAVLAAKGLFTVAGAQMLLNKAVRAFPIAKIAVLLGFLAEQTGLIDDLINKVKEKFPELAEGMAGGSEDAVGFINDLTGALSEIDNALDIDPNKFAIGGVIENQMSAIKVATASAAQGLDEVQKRARAAGDMVANSFENAFMSAVEGTSSFKDAFRSMAAEIIRELFRIFVVKKITGFISNAITAAINPAAAATTAALPSFQGGGYTGGGPRAGGLDGRGGRLAVVHPRETIVDHTQPGSMAGVVVNQTVNISTGVQQTVRSEIRSLLPQIAESAKAAVIDAKRRGGSYGKAFA